VEATTSPQTGSPSQAISNGAVHLLREYTGRGPTKAKTTISENLVVLILKDTMTKAEHQLAAKGKEDKVLDIRHEFQKVMRDELIALVEKETGRKVDAFMSDNHIDPDLAAEVFVLEPAQTVS
jgi:uncharacterized protein YbcI